ncbi:MAG: 3-isopropylmalate dehydratase small subunit [Desulfarculales bacterium]|jgi:3-isopropylmalate/(R)-2-methylmalate dehydratase small subunit|nr:3-isopropylmalate dehydratase small subunit [Desulfarculales bacterium]
MRIWKFGDLIDTDQIIAGTYLQLNDPAELAKHLFEKLRPEMAGQVQAGDIIIAGRRLGIGSSREQAVLAIKGAGVRLVAAESFARIFFRNAVNLGLPLLEVPDAGQIREDEEIAISETGIISLSSGREYKARPLAPFIRNITEAGGLMAYVRRNLVKGG